MSTNYSFLLSFSVLYIQMIRIYAVDRLQRKRKMRILKREAEGGITIIDWHGGFLGVSKNGHNWRHFRAWFDNCPCCKGAFDLGIEAFGFELMAYNDGGPCELEEYYEDFQHDLTRVEAAR